MKFASFTCYSFKNTQLLLGSVASVGARVTTVASMLVITAIAARMMTKEEFGLWTILVTFIYLSWALDLGFRYGMGNRLAPEEGLQPNKENSTYRYFSLPS